MKNPHYLVIMAGGSGTRLWPLSRKNLPKQFLKVGSNLSLVQETAQRLLEQVGWENVRIVCGRDHHRLMQKEFPELKEHQFLLEPMGKNTAAAIALAAHALLQENPEAAMSVLPADHKIPQKDLGAFQDSIASAFRFCRGHGGLLTLGIRPTYPATGYGYLHRGEKVGEEGVPFYRVLRFQEKPDFETAESYLKSGEYCWNSGMFVWTAAEYWKAYEAHLPQDASAMNGLKGAVGSPDWNRKLDDVYPKLTSISVDYAILEKSDRVRMIDATFGWDDVGSLASLSAYYPRDLHGNAASGQTALVDSAENLVLSDGGVVACLGVENLVVIRNGDAVLVAPKERSEEVKALLEEMKKKGYGQYL
ncbi:MAG: sugar phosphate nucleotidyltransferase [bacterium]